MKILDYGRPDPPPAPQMRWPFRIGAWVLFIAGLFSMIVSLVEVFRGNARFGMGMLLVTLFGCVMFGRMAIWGKYP